jgi:hydrogenase maturation protease
MPSARVLVAGVGNLFLGDDGFGPEVVRRLLAGGAPPPGVHVTDYGIRGIQLAYDLLDGWDTLILVDALPAGPGPAPARLSDDRPGSAQPGQVTVAEVSAADLEGSEPGEFGLPPIAILGSLTAMGGKLPPTYLVGCPVESVHEGIGLSPSVSAAVPAAIDAVLDLLDRLPLIDSPSHPDVP